MLAPSSSCTITVTPDATATSDCKNGTAPVPGVVQVSSDSATAVSTNVVVLGYGCVYQGGYVYAFDDTTPNTGSVGGKVVTTSDQATPGVIWSSDSIGNYDGGIAVFGITQLSTTVTPDPISGQIPGQTACNGATDGLCDTTNIVVYYSLPQTNPAINQSFYAAGLCKATISGHADWYLPAICEMGFHDGVGVSSQCGTQANPTLQNMQSSLVDNSTLRASTGVLPRPRTILSSSRGNRSLVRVVLSLTPLSMIPLRLDVLGF